MATNNQTTCLFGAGDLLAPVRIVCDQFGLTHIFAENERDVFFAQGFNVAEERLWQIDLWRRRGLGLLAEVLGPGFVAQDRASRLFVYTADMDLEWASYSDGTRQICEDFCRGINAYVDRVSDGLAPLPREFSKLGFTPSHWSAADIVRIRNNTLTTNGLSELKRAALLDAGHAVADSLRFVLKPWKPDLTSGASIAESDRLIALLELAVAPVLITRERLSARFEDIELWADPRTFSHRPESAQPPGASSAIADGSNNWAISGARTASGKPILANDPHRALQRPSLRYAVHLHCPSFSVIGAGEPSLPGISIGHNGHVAFGLTIFPADQEDVFVFDTERAASGALSSRTETIAVRGCGPISAQILQFAGCPVLRMDADGGRGVAIRTVWSEPGASPYLGSLALLEAKTVGAFREALKCWRLPAVNYVVADRAGSIGWFVAGAIPKRKAGSGCVPRYADEDPWDGFVTNDDLPMRIDPPCGYVMSSNEFNLPDSWDSTAVPVAFEWYESFRARRVNEVLERQSSGTVEASLRLQDDILSVAANDLVALLKSSIDTRDLVSQHDLIAQLLMWDGVIDNEERCAAFYFYWLNEILKPRALAALEPGTRMSTAEISTEALIKALIEAPDQTRASILGGSLLVAARAFRYGARPRRALFRHAIDDNVTTETFSTGDVVWQGDDTTVHFGKSGRSRDTVEFGASFRMVVDLSDWDASLWSNVPDQTIEPTGSSAPVPLLYSTPQIEANAISSVILAPE